MKLFRPTGLNELRLVFSSGMQAWPPRLPEQPIFYPVLNRPYAQQIARDWNTQANEFVGYVTRFTLHDSFASQFELKVVGGSQHAELWIPAEQVEEMNSRIVGKIEVIDAYFGPNFQGLMPKVGQLAGKNAEQQLDALMGQFRHNRQDFHGEISQNAEAVFLQFPFWCLLASQMSGRHAKTVQKILEAVQRQWEQVAPGVSLCSVGLPPDR